MKSDSCWWPLKFVWCVRVNRGRVLWEFFSEAIADYRQWKAEERRDPEGRIILIYPKLVSRKGYEYLPEYQGP